MAVEAIGSSPTVADEHGPPEAFRPPRRSALDADVGETPASRILLELKGIRQAQKRMEAVLGRLQQGQASEEGLLAKILQAKDGTVARLHAQPGEANGPSPPLIGERQERLFLRGALSGAVAEVCAEASDGARHPAEAASGPPAPRVPPTKDEPARSDESDNSLPSGAAAAKTVQVHFSSFHSDYNSEEDRRTRRSISKETRSSYKESRNSYKESRSSYKDGGKDGGQEADRRQSSKEGAARQRRSRSDEVPPRSTLTRGAGQNRSKELAPAASRGSSDDSESSRGAARTDFAEMSGGGLGKSTSSLAALTRAISSGELMARTPSELESEAMQGRFIAATLPLSWPSVLRPREKYERDRNLSAMAQIRHTVVAASRMEGCRRSSVADAMELSSMGRRRISVTLERFVMAPGSHPHMVWSSLSFFVLLYDFTLIPVALAWDLAMEGLLYVTSWMSVMFWTLDIGASCMTAFHKNGELVFHSAAIVKRYLRTWFLIDMVAVSGDWVSLCLQSMSETSASSVRTVRMVKIARMLRIIGVLRMLRFLNVIREYVEKQCSGYYRVAMKTASLLFGTLLLTHTFACAWFAIGKLGPSDTGVRWTDVFWQDPVRAEANAYQYLTSFHWAVAQMTLGSTDVLSGNSMERFFNVFCLLTGLIFSCTLVSSLSATLVDSQMSHKDQNTKLDGLRKYLKVNNISTTTCMLVQDQIAERLAEEKQTRIGEESTLKLLSQGLFSKLRYEVFWPTISTHPLLHLWGYMHLPTMHKLCVEALSFRDMRPSDDLFLAGSTAEEAFHLSDGELEYTQRPDSSPVMEETSTNVEPGTWLCEAALWTNWTHVGTAVAAQRCQLVVVKAEPFLKVCKEHHVVNTVVSCYGEVFHRKVQLSVPPEAEYPNDLEVPRTHFAEIVISMQREAQVAIGLNVLQRAEQKMGSNSWAAWRLGHLARGNTHQFQDLEEEVMLGRCLVIQNNTEEVERVAAVTCAKLVNDSGEILVQIGKQEEDGALHPLCQWPGHKLENDDEPCDQRLRAVLEVKLPGVADLADKVEVVGVKREVSQEVSRRYAMMKTTYFRTIVMARLAEEDWDAQPIEKPDMSPAATAKRSTKMTAKHSLHNDAHLLEGLLARDVYRIDDATGHCSLYAWMPEETFDYLHTASTGPLIINEWVRSLVEVGADIQKQSNPSSRRSSAMSRPSVRSTQSVPLSFMLEYDGPSESKPNLRKSMSTHVFGGRRSQEGKLVLGRLPSRSSLRHSSGGSSYTVNASDFDLSRRGSRDAFAEDGESLEGEMSL